MPVSWVETQPAGNFDFEWSCCALDGTGQHAIAGRGTNFVSAVGGRLYLSTDFCASWNEVQPAGNVDRNWSSLAMSDDGQFIIACIYSSVNGRIWKSINGGLNWSELQPAGNVNRAWSSVCCSSDGRYLIASIFNGRIYRSANFGVNWAEIKPEGAFTNSYWSSTAIDDDGTVNLAGDGVANPHWFAFFSTDGAVTWAQAPGGGIAAGAWYSVDCDSDGSFMVVAGSSGGAGRRIWRTQNSGVNWDEVRPDGNNNYNWRKVACSSNGQYLIAGDNSTTHGHLYTSIDSGDNWIDEVFFNPAPNFFRGIAVSRDGNKYLAQIQHDDIPAIVFHARIWSGTLIGGYKRLVNYPRNKTLIGR